MQLRRWIDPNEYLVLLHFLENHPSAYNLSSDFLAPFYAVFLFHTSRYLLSDDMHLFTLAFSCEYIFNRSNNDSDVSTDLHNYHSLIGFHQLPMKLCFVLVVEALEVKCFLCHISDSHILLILRHNFQSNNQHQLG